MLCLFAGGSVGREEPVDQARIGDADLLLRDASGVVEREVKNIARAVIARCIKGGDVVGQTDAAQPCTEGGFHVITLTLFPFYPGFIQALLPCVSSCSFLRKDI